MGSTVPFSMLRDPKLVDVIDEEWKKETLPVDDVILPKGMETLTLDPEDTLDDKTDQTQGWGDLGLQEFQQPH